MVLPLNLHAGTRDSQQSTLTWVLVLFIPALLPRPWLLTKKLPGVSTKKERKKENGAVEAGVGGGGGGGWTALLTH